MKAKIFGDTDNCLIKNNKYNKNLIKKILNKEGIIPLGNSSPSKEFEKISHVKGVSHKWNIPYGFSDNQMEDIMTCCSLLFLWEHEEFNSLYEDFVKINPEIKKLPPGINKFDVMMGMTSCFNFDDIKYFVVDLFNHQTKKRIYVGMESDHYKEKESKIYTELRKSGIKNYEIEWRVSEKTMNYMIKELRKINQIKKYSEL